MKLSIIIITWNQISYLKECLVSLEKLFDCIEVEIILVDNGSSDGSIEFVNSVYPNIRLIVNNRNKGVAFARNRGIEISKGEFILILDNDTVVNSQAIVGMLDYIQSHHDVGLCSCQLIDHLGNIQESWKEFPGFGLKLKNFFNIETKSNHKSYPNSPFEPFYVIGACQMIRRNVLESVGLLDENIFYGPEDADLCMRIRNSGWKIVYLPQYNIIHHWRRITNSRKLSLIAWKHICGLCYFYFKHKRIY